MSSVNLYAKEISLKIVYYGPGLGGKTSSLQYIHRAIKPEARGQLVSLSTGIDRTLYFDFLPVKLPKLRGYTVRVQLYTVPGQVHYNSTRKLVLTGADGVVFVADSQRDRREANIESLQNLQENLHEQGLGLERLPHLLQYNKRDVKEIMTVAELDAALNAERAPSFETAATSGVGVFEALKAMTTLVLNDLRRRGVWRADTQAGSSPLTQEPLLGELRDEPSQPNRLGGTTEGSIAASLQALADRGTETGVPMLSPLRPEELPPANDLMRGAALSEILPPSPLRLAVARVEDLVQAGDYAAAVNAAAQAFAELARDGAQAAGAPTPEAPLLHALLLGVPGERYLRFRALAVAAAAGGASSADALFAIFFLVDVALRTRL